MDANEIPYVTAKDTATGRSSNICITNDKGRLSREEIDIRIVNNGLFF